MVAIFKNEFNHPFYAVALTKESAIHTLYDVSPQKAKKSATPRCGGGMSVLRTQVFRVS